MIGKYAIKIDYFLLFTFKEAKLNNIDCVRIIAKEIVNTKKTIKRLHIAKTHINSIFLQIKI